MIPRVAVPSPFGQDPLSRRGAHMLAAKLRVVAAPARLMILGHLHSAGADGVTGAKVTELIGHLAASTIADHLRVLVDYGFAEQQGRSAGAVYRLNPAGLSELVTVLIPGGTR